MNSFFDTSIKTDKFETSSTITGLVQFKLKEYFLLKPNEEVKFFVWFSKEYLLKGSFSTVHLLLRLAWIIQFIRNLRMDSVSWSVCSW